MENCDETFLERIISNISDSGCGILFDEDLEEDEIKILLTDSFKKGGNEGLTKELEKNNFFIYSFDVDYPSNSSLVADIDWCIWFRNDMDIEEYTFLYIECPDEYRIYLHKSSSAHRLYGHTIELINTYNLKTDIGEVFEETVKDYMIDDYWNTFELVLESEGGQRFLPALDEGDFSKDFNLDGIGITQGIKDEAHQKILKNIEENNEED